MIICGNITENNMDNSIFRTRKWAKLIGWVDLVVGVTGIVATFVFLIIFSLDSKRKVNFYLFAFAVVVTSFRIIAAYMLIKATKPGAGLKCLNEAKRFAQVHLILSVILLLCISAGTIGFLYYNNGIGVAVGLVVYLFLENGFCFWGVYNYISELNDAIATEAADNELYHI